MKITPSNQLTALTQAPDQEDTFKGLIDTALVEGAIDAADHGAVVSALGRAAEASDSDKTRFLGGDSDADTDADKTRILGTGAAPDSASVEGSERTQFPLPNEADEVAARARMMLEPDRFVDEDPTDMRRSMPRGAGRGKGDPATVRDPERPPSRDDVTEMGAVEFHEADTLDADEPTTFNAAQGDEDATLVRAEPGSTPAAANQEAVNNGASDDEEVTVFNPTAADSGRPSASDDDETVLNSDSLEPATVRAASPAEPVDPDATRVLGGADPDRTAVLDGNGGEGGGSFDILSPDAQVAAENATAAPTITQVRNVRPPGHEFGAGDVLKERFELVSKLGEGGMGAVWKALDRLKAEARDRNPYVAVKLLQGDFKEHPESFIALQRETSKQQRLAHPNVATVYDFDRDGDTVYMTMEAMEGLPMDAFLRKLPAGGLPEEEAMPLIEDICAGLAYAHAAGLVHSDLKPGNAYLVEDPDRPHGRVKLLDFGIARASKTKTDAEGETTLFDPGQLGALTPTYATIEMFEGVDPDPRDDIYALGIMSYQLFIGKHPYARKSAPKAQELGLTPEFVEKLDKRQNRGLARGVAFSRDARTPSVEQFLEDVRKRKSRVGLFAAIGLAACLVLGVGAYGPVNDYIARQDREKVLEVITRPGIENIVRGLEQAAIMEPEQKLLVFQDERARDSVISLMTSGDETLLRQSLEIVNKEGFEALRQTIQSDERANDAVASLFQRGDEESIKSGLGLIAPFDATWRRIIMDDARVKDAIFGLYTGKMYAVVDQQKNLYDYAEARRSFATLDQLYPDSADVFRIGNELTAHREGQIERLSSEYRALLAQGKVLRADDADDIYDPLATLRIIEPEHGLFTDPDRPGRFAELVREAMQADDFAQALVLAEAGLVDAPGHADISSLQTEVVAELQRRANAARAVEIETALTGGAPVSSMRRFDDVRTDLLELASLKPGSAVLLDLQTKLAPLQARAQRTLIESGQLSAAQQVLVDYARLTPVRALLDQRAALSAAEAIVGAPPPRADAGQEHRKVLERALANPSLDEAWERQLSIPYRELIALLPAANAALTTYQEEIAAFYHGQASSLRLAQNFDAAARMVERGQVLVPNSNILDAEALAIVAAAEALARKQAEERQLAKIEQLKSDTLAHASADRPLEAKAVMDELATEIGAEDAFLQVTGPQAIAQSYLRLSKASEANSQNDAARNLARAGLTFAPGLQGLLEAERGLSKKLMQAAGRFQMVPRVGRIAGVAAVTGAASVVAPPLGSSELPVAAPSSRALGLPPQRVSLPAVEVSVADQNPALGSESERAVAAGISALVNAQPLQVSALTTPLELHAKLFPSAAAALRASVASALEARLLTQAGQGGVDVQGLLPSLREHEALLPKRHAALRGRVVRIQGDAILALTESESVEVASLGPPLADFAAAYPKLAPELRAKIGERLGQHIGALAQADPLDVPSLGAPLADFAAAFPELAAELRGRVGSSLGLRVDALAQSVPLDVAAVAGVVAQLGELFPDQVGDVRARAGSRLGDRLGRMAEAQPLKLEVVEPHLSDLRADFPAAYTDAKDAVIAVSSEALLNLDISTAAKIAAMGTPLGTFARLFPERSSSVKQQLADRATKRLVNAKLSTPEQLNRLTQPVAAFSRLFPDRANEIRRQLAKKAATSINALAKQDVYRADALKRAALSALPGSAAIMAIRLELPLEEIKKGKALLARGKLIGARGMLKAAIAQDPEHSDIPAYRSALETRENQALAAYDKYRGLTKNRGSRKDRTASLAAAKRLWADNTKFVTLKEPRPGLCSPRLAGQGASKRSVCYDKLSTRRKGPMLVVIPAGGAFKSVFAMTKFEISVSDFNLFCKATKKCKPRLRTGRQPVTNIDIALARVYTEWLSTTASKVEEEALVYRLPTAAEWEYAASGGGKQPARQTFNCRVSSGGQVIKGHSLVAVKSGKPNGWGLTNYVGNAQEWVESGGGVSARGGAYTDELSRCRPNLVRPHSGAADPITGFRLVRGMGG